MSDAIRVLEKIEEGLVQHGGDLGGWTRLQEETLQIFDGRVTLRAEVIDQEPSAETVHVHVRATLHDHDDEVLDACLMGMGNNREESLAQVAVIWMTGVAGPIRSFLEAKPVCMTCQAGVQNGDICEGYSQGDYGLPNLRAYVGPSFSRGFNTQPDDDAVGDTKPWFQYAAESAAPRRVHLAKATVISNRAEGWSRELEIDGHDVSYHDPTWPADGKDYGFGYLVRYAVFEFPRNSSEIARRAELERTIHHFIKNFSKYENVDDLIDEMEEEGFDPDLVHQVESLSTIAFGRLFFEPYGVQYSPTIIRACRDGQVQMNVPLMSLPAYTRARAIGAHMFGELSEEERQSLCFYDAESHAILNMFGSAGKEADLSGAKMFPCVVPDRGVTQATMEVALAKLQELIEQERPKKKPWWKFW